ncbi:MAG: ATP synthase F1 subunit epsilon [Planctomycetota bacterium]|nr:ATP synthase F1 subunit epsilon [Planctomycetota bacterium]
MATLTLRVITPARIALDQQVDAVRLEALDGSLGVLPRHAPMVAALDAGLLRYRSAGVEQVLFCAGGFAEVHGETLRVVTQASETPGQIDEARARASEKRARARIDEARAPGTAPVDIVRAEASLRRALLRLQAKGYAAGG